MTAARVNDLWISGFNADTPVLMADGKTKPISEIKEGEMVVSFDPVTKLPELGLVTGTFASTMNDLVSIKADGKSEMIVAGKQRFFTPAGEFKTAADAEAILDRNGHSKEFTAKKIAGKAKIYDITVMPNHSFYADGLAVHNGGGGGGSPPPPPPDPVVTAGKVGKPLEVTVNGNKVSVSPQPGEAARVSVDHKGNVKYNGTPGVAVMRGTLRPIANPRSPDYLAAINKTQNAIDTETTVCSSMKGTSGSVTAATKASWVSQLDTLSNEVTEARRLANFGTVTKISSPTEYSTIGRRGSGDITGFDQVQREVADLKKFVNKQRNLTNKELDFISGKCAKIDTQLNDIKTNLSSRNFELNIFKQPKIWQLDPNYGYFQSAGNGTYSFQPPSSETSTPGYYKHFDAATSQYYYDKEPANAV